jgi:hypothetical protein
MARNFFTISDYDLMKKDSMEFGVGSLTQPYTAQRAQRQFVFATTTLTLTEYQAYNF